MHYEVAVVHEDPAEVVEALHGPRASGAGQFELALDFVTYGVYLARVGATCDHERVSQPQKVLDAEHERVATKLRRGGSGCQDDAVARLVNGGAANSGTIALPSSRSVGGEGQEGCTSLRNVWLVWMGARLAGPWLPSHCNPSRTTVTRNAISSTRTATIFSVLRLRRSDRLWLLVRRSGVSANVLKVGSGRDPRALVIHLKNTARAP